MDKIETILSTTLKAEIIKTLNNAPDAIEKMVTAAMSKPVNEAGGKPGYSDKTIPYLDFIIGEELRRFVVVVLREHIENNKEAIKEKVVSSIEQADLGGPLGEKIASYLSEDYNWTVDLRMQDNRDY